MWVVRAHKQLRLSRFLVQGLTGLTLVSYCPLEPLPTENELYRPQFFSSIICQDTIHPGTGKSRLISRDDVRTNTNGVVAIKTPQIRRYVITYRCNVLWMRRPLFLSDLEGKSPRWSISRKPSERDMKRPNISWSCAERALRIMEATRMEPNLRAIVVAHQYHRNSAV